MAVVHGLRWFQPLPIRIYELVSYDVGFKKVWNEMRYLKLVF